MRKPLLFCFLMIVILITAFLVIKTNKRPAYKIGISSIYDTAVYKALSLYAERVKDGTDMSNGPCLTNDLLPSWVVDVVHSPREAVDDLPANQCQAYLEKRAIHFVELDINGNLVRVR